jgi:general secretion pathway protein D
MTSRYLRSFTTFLVLFALGAGMLPAKAKPDQLLKDAQAAEVKEDWDRALELYLQAMEKKPNDTTIMISMRRARFQAGAMHVKKGQKIRSEGKLEDALSEFQKAIVADPSSSIAVQELKRTQQMINTEKNQPSSKSDDRGLTPAERERKQTDTRLASLLPPPELKPVLRTIGPLTIHNQPLKVQFETVGKVAGVNVLFDSTLPPSTHNYNLDLPLSTPEQAFDYLAVMTHTFWKPVGATAIFVAEDNATKHRDYDDEVMKTVYVTNSTTVQDFQEIATAVRQLAEIRRTFTSNALRAIVMRGPADAVEMAEKLIHDLDKPKSEVVIDIIVMQANTSRTRDLAASIVNSSGSPGLSLPISFNPSNPVTIGGTTTSTTSTTSPTTTTTPVTTTTTPTSTTGTTAIALSGLGHISTSDFSTSLPGALLNMIMTDSKTKVLNSPTVRASEGQKVQLAIGQKIPYATGSFQPGVGTVGVSPLVSTQFNFIDVGVNVDITPTAVHSGSEVSLHIEINVSSVASYVDLGGGLSQPVVSQNKNIADIRLREGEVNILGGLSSISDTKSYGGIPGLTDIPVLGHVLFGNDHTDKENSQLLIALVPHIIRAPDFSQENLRSIFVGSETLIKLNHAAAVDEKSAPAPVTLPAIVIDSPAAALVPATAPQATPPPAAPAAQPSIPGLPPGLRLGVPGVMAPGLPRPPAPTAPPTAPATPANGSAKLSFALAPMEVAAGSPVTARVQIENAADVFSASPIKIKYDPAKLRLNDVVPGELFSRDGVRVTSEKDIRNDSGEATLTVSRMPGSAGVSGSGTLVTLSFIAVGKGDAVVTLTDAGLKNSQQQPLAVPPAEITVKVQ